MISSYKTIQLVFTILHSHCRGGVPVTGMLAGMNLSKPRMNLSKAETNLSKPGKNTTIMLQLIFIRRRIFRLLNKALLSDFRLGHP